MIIELLKVKNIKIILQLSRLKKGKILFDITKSEYEGEYGKIIYQSK